jgi:hypothetical protein
MEDFAVRERAQKQQRIGVRNQEMKNQRRYAFGTEIAAAAAAAVVVARH